MAEGSPSKTAVVAQVIKHWPARVGMASAKDWVEKPNSKHDTPGRPSGVRSVSRRLSMPASTSQAITDEAKPVKLRAAVSAQYSSCAVMMTRAKRMPKASANVSSISVEPIFNKVSLSASL